MPSLDKLASLSKRMKETKIVVQPGGGQDGTENETVTPASSALAEVTHNVAARPMSSGAPSVGGAGLEGAMLQVRDAVVGVAAELRSARPGTSPHLSQKIEAIASDVAAIKDQIEAQAIQLAEILRLLR